MFDKLLETNFCWHYYYYYYYFFFLLLFIRLFCSSSLTPQLFPHYCGVGREKLGYVFHEPLSSKLYSLGLNLDAAVNCHHGVLHVGQCFIRETQMDTGHCSECNICVHEDCVRLTVNDDKLFVPNCKNWGWSCNAHCKTKTGNFTTFNWFRMLIEPAADDSVCLDFK